jgi:hypothetical protein
VASGDVLVATEDARGIADRRDLIAKAVAKPTAASAIRRLISRVRVIAPPVSPCDDPTPRPSNGDASRQIWFIREFIITERSNSDSKSSLDEFIAH